MRSGLAHAHAVGRATPPTQRNTTPRQTLQLHATGSAALDYFVESTACPTAPRRSAALPCRVPHAARRNSRGSCQRPMRRPHSETNPTRRTTWQRGADVTRAAVMKQAGRRCFQEPVRSAMPRLRQTRSVCCPFTPVIARLPSLSLGVISLPGFCGSRVMRGRAVSPAPSVWRVVLVRAWWWRLRCRCRERGCLSSPRHVRALP